MYVRYAHEWIKMYYYMHTLIVYVCILVCVVWFFVPCWSRRQWEINNYTMWNEHVNRKKSCSFQIFIDSESKYNKKKMENSRSGIEVAALVAPTHRSALTDKAHIHTHTLTLTNTGMISVSEWNGAQII